MAPLNQRSGGKRRRKTLPVAERLCRDNGEWGLVTVTDIQHKLSHILVNYDIFGFNIEKKN